MNQNYNFNWIIQNMNYKHDYLKSSNPLQNYYSNIPIDPKTTQIKKYFNVYAESRVLRTFPWSNLKLLMSRINLKTKKRNPLLNQEHLATNLKKLSQVPALAIRVLIPTSSLNLSKDHFLIMLVNNARRSNLLKSHQKIYLKYLKLSLDIWTLIWNDTLQSLMKEFTDSQMKTR